MKRTLFLLCYILLFASGCNQEKNIPNEPIFRGGTNWEMYWRLRSFMLPDERLSFLGENVNTNGQIIKKLSIKVFNAERIPENETDLKHVSASIATVVRESLIDKNQFDHYTVQFILKEPKPNGKSESDVLKLNLTDLNKEID
jgi:hypothetical protein